MKKKIAYRIAKILIERYEQYAIDSNQDEEYLRKKNLLLGRKSITYNEFYDFIEDTKENEDTYFSFDSDFYQKILRKVQNIGMNKQVLFSDVEFKNMLYICFNGFNEAVYQEFNQKV